MAIVLTWNTLQKYFLSIYKFLWWLYESMHVGGAHYNDKEFDIFKKINSINYGMNCACEGGAWGLGQLKDYSRWPRGQCAFVLSRSNPSTFFSCSTASPNCSTTSPSSFSTSTTNIDCSPINSDYGTIHLLKYSS